MSNTFLDLNFKNNFINHFDLVINEIDFETEQEILEASGENNSEVNSKRLLMIRNVQKIQTNNLKYIKCHMNRLDKITLFNKSIDENKFCFYLKRKIFKSLKNKTGLLVVTNFYLTNSQINDIKDNISIKYPINNLNKTSILIDYVLKSISNFQDQTSFVILIDIDNLHNQFEIDFSNRKCEQISNRAFDLFKNDIKVLNLCNNCFNKFDFKACLRLKRLEELNLEFNQIQNFELNFVHLKKLNLSNNNLKILKNEIFSKLINLVELDLSDNKISEIEERVFEPLKELGYLSLANNQIKSICFNLSKCLKLTQLHLASNRIRSIHETSFQNLQLLQVLNISNNLIESISEPVCFNGLISLKNINLNQNSIRFIDFRSFQSLLNLVELDLYCNHIKTIENLNELKFFQNLETLNLSENLIEHIHTTCSISLKTLALSKNKLTTLDPFIMPCLENLYLSNNRLSTINHGLFEKCNNLKVIDLSANLIEYLDQNILNYLPNLEEIDLTKNLIKIFPNKIFSCLNVKF